MYKISEFSQITGLTLKALRYYDEQNILVPSHRDEVTGYRYYSGDDCGKAQRLLLLRSLDFSVSEIRDVFAGTEKDEDVLCFLAEKKKMIEENILTQTRLIARINERLSSAPLKPYNGTATYNIETAELPPVTALSVQFTGEFRDIGTRVPILYRAAKGNAAGHYFSCYYSSEVDEDMKIELCLPLRQAVRRNEFMEQNNIVIKKFPKQTGLRTIHTGPYEELRRAYRALIDYGHENTMELIFPSREIYIKGPGMIFRGNEQNYRTELLIPCKRREV